VRSGNSYFWTINKFFCEEKEKNNVIETGERGKNRLRNKGRDGDDRDRDG
jgi:hypothetical protein